VDLRTLLTNSLSPFSKVLAFLSHFLVFLPSGMLFIFSIAYLILPAFVLMILAIIRARICSFDFILPTAYLQSSKPLFFRLMES